MILYMWTFVTCTIMIPFCIDFKMPFLVPLLIVSAVYFFYRMLEVTTEQIIERWG